MERVTEFVLVFVPLVTSTIGATVAFRSNSMAGCGWLLMLLSAALVVNGMLIYLRNRIQVRHNVPVPKVSGNVLRALSPVINDVLVAPVFKESLDDVGSTICTRDVKNGGSVFV